MVLVSLNDFLSWLRNMSPPVSPPFQNFTFRDREDVMCENDSDASYDTDEERKRFQYELLKEEFPECFMPIPRGIPRICYCCKDPVVVRAENGRMLLECETKKVGFSRHYRRWWDEAIVEDLEDRTMEIRVLRARVGDLEKIVSDLEKIVKKK